MAANEEQQQHTAWLFKAEPDSRIVNGKDVKFSVDDFEECRTSSWDGVRNRQASGFMRKDIKLGHRGLFYQSNCKEPGVVATCKVSRESYPDHTAFDAAHPYYDPKSKEESPTWYMVDVEFEQRLKHMVSLKTLQALASHTKPPSELEYLSQEQLDAIKDMVLLKRGRLSVQPVSDTAFDAIVSLGTNGGLGFLTATTSSSKRKTEASSSEAPPKKSKRKTR